MVRRRRFKLPPVKRAALPFPNEEKIKKPMAEDSQPVGPRMGLSPKVPYMPMTPYIKRQFPKMTQTDDENTPPPGPKRGRRY